MTSNPFVSTTSGLTPNAGVTGAPGAITATSSTPQAIGLGNLSFQVPTLAAWAPGMFVSAVDQSNSSNYMVGVVQSYSGTTLVIDMLFTNGSGTPVAWYINLTAPVTEGNTGPQGPAGTNGSNAGPVIGGTQGLKITNDATTASTKIDITASNAVMVNTGGTSVSASAVSVVIDITTGTSTSAANGMDGEGRGTSGWVYTYLINNGTTTAGLATKASPLSSAPTLPAGYTYYTYVGAMYVDGSGNLLRTMQKRNRTNYVVTAATNTASLPVLGNGTAGSVSTPTWVGITLAGFVPPTASDILVVANGDVGGTPATVIAAPNNAYGTATSTNPPPVAAITGSVESISPMPVESTSIFWASSGTDGYLFCAGWNDYVAAA